MRRCLRGFGSHATTLIDQHSPTSTGRVSFAVVAGMLVMLGVFAYVSSSKVVYQHSAHAANAENAPLKGALLQGKKPSDVFNPHRNCASMPVRAGVSEFCDWDLNVTCPALPVAGKKWVIATSLYGKDPRYTEGVLASLAVSRYRYPGWIFRVYHDSSVPASSLQLLRKANIELVKVAEPSNGATGRFWRFLANDDPLVELFIVRDGDSRPLARETSAVCAWIDSGKRFHVMRDYRGHTGLMAGMWGARTSLIHNMSLLMSRWNYLTHGVEAIGDQIFLRDVIWSQVQSETLGHDAYFCDRFVGGVPFPTQRTRDLAFVGEQVLASGKLNPGKCVVKTPTQCRGDPSWIYG